MAQAESGCDSIVINHQSDLDSIRNCKEYGDIKIGHRFTGDLEIRDVFRFSALTNEICQDCDSEDATAAITSLKVSDDVSEFGIISLHDLYKMKTIELPLVRGDTLSLRNLPALESAKTELIRLNNLTLEGSTKIKVFYSHRPVLLGV